MGGLGLRPVSERDAPGNPLCCGRWCSPRLLPKQQQGTGWNRQPRCCHCGTGLPFSVALGSCLQKGFSRNTPVSQFHSLTFKSKAARAELGSKLTSGCHDSCYSEMAPVTRVLAQRLTGVQLPSTCRHFSLCTAPRHVRGMTHISLLPITS